MLDATTRIKNLSIALEALSRINTSGSLTHYLKIENLLKAEEALAEREHDDQLRARSAKPCTTGPFTGIAQDDDIPF